MFWKVDVNSLTHLDFLTFDSVDLHIRLDKTICASCIGFISLDHGCNCAKDLGFLILYFFFSSYTFVILYKARYL